MPSPDKLKVHFKLTVHTHGPCGLSGDNDHGSSIKDSAPRDRNDIVAPARARERLGTSRVLQRASADPRA